MGGTSQHTMRKQEGEGHSPTIEHRAMDKSGQQEKRSEGHSLPVEHRWDQSEHQGEVRERVALTNCHIFLVCIKNIVVAPEKSALMAHG
jgi:hypothetical protein